MARLTPCQLGPDHTRFQTNYSLFLAMLLVLPQNGAILIVWLRNLQAGWYAPFPSDHNVLAIAGYLGIVELAQTGWTCRVGASARYITRLQSATSAVLLVLTGVVLLLSARYAFVAGIATNVFFCWLYAIQHI